MYLKLKYKTQFIQLRNFKVAPRVGKTEIFRKGGNCAHRTYFVSCIMKKQYFLCIMKKQYFLLWTKETSFFIFTMELLSTVLSYLTYFKTWGAHWGTSLVYLDNVVSGQGNDFLPMYNIYFINVEF